jgi:hypothetical protein
MKYETIYNNLIQKRKRDVPEGYTELHHIIPRSLGGSDTKDNLVRLTAREHYLAHYLLMKMQVPKSGGYYSMLKAFLMMQVQHESGLRYIPGHKFENLRKIDSERKSITMLGKKNHILGKRWIWNPNTEHTKLHDPTIELPHGYIFGQKKTKKLCPVCGKVFYKRSNVTCSKECRKVKNLRIGSDVASTKLTRPIVDAIRNGSIGKGMTDCEIAKMLGVSNVTIHNVKTYRTWK